MLKKLSDSFHSLSVWVVSNFDDHHRRDQASNGIVGGGLKSSQSANMLHSYGVRQQSTLVGSFPNSSFLSSRQQRVVSSDDIHKIVSAVAPSTSTSRTPKKKKLSSIFSFRELRKNTGAGSMSLMKRSRESTNFHHFLRSSPSTQLSNEAGDHCRAINYVAESTDADEFNGNCVTSARTVAAIEHGDHIFERTLTHAAANCHDALCNNFETALNFDEKSSGRKTKNGAATTDSLNGRNCNNNNNAGQGIKLELVKSGGGGDSLKPQVCYSHEDSIVDEAQQRNATNTAVTATNGSDGGRVSRKDSHLLKKLTSSNSNSTTSFSWKFAKNKIRRHSSAKCNQKISESTTFDVNQDTGGFFSSKGTPSKKATLAHSESSRTFLRNKHVAITFSSESGSTSSAPNPPYRRVARPKSEHIAVTQRLSRSATRGLCNDLPAFQEFFGRKENYEKREKLGEGSYAMVYKGHSLIDGSIVALKEIRLQPEEGVPFTAIREASLLKGLKHANIVLLHDIIHTKESLTFVFEYVRGDLSHYLEKHPMGINPHNVKLFLYQLLRGLAFCHDKKILHRDLKPQNLLISEAGELKLADFGLARAKSVPSHTYSHEVVTLWYRPPDVLLGSTTYSTSLDMWGVGCIFAEMLTGCALFPGAKDIYDQLDKIFRVMGTPTEATWEGVSALPNFDTRSLNDYPRVSWAEAGGVVTSVAHAESLLDALLQMNPDNRMNAREAMAHPYFSDLPQPVHILPHISSIFIVPGIKLVPESKASSLQNWRT